MRQTTPFFRAFGPLLFGKPSVSSLAHAFAKFSEDTSLSQLRKVFGSLIPKALLAPAAKGANSRRRLYSLDSIFWSFLDQVQTPGGSCREAVRKALAYSGRKVRRQKPPLISPQTTAYCKARAKIPLQVIDDIHAHLVDRMQAHIPHNGLWHGRHVKIVDGTGLSMPDTPSNQARWPQSKNQKPGCGFPSMKLVGVFCLLTGALVKAVSSDRHTHESKLFQKLWSVLNPGDLLLADRGFCSFGNFAALRARNVDCLMRLPENKIRIAIGSQLPKSGNFDVIITWKRPAQCPPAFAPEEFAVLPDSLAVRVVRYTVAHPGFRSQSITIVTTLLEDGIVASDLASLYFRRWRIELHFREIKTHLNLDVLRCLSPHMIERELRMHFIAYNLVRSIMQKSALTHDEDLERLSFKGCLDTLRQFANAAGSAVNKPRAISTLIDEMLLVIASDLIPHRPGRCEPRVRKRRPKNYRLLTKPRHKFEPLPHRKYGVENHPKSRLS